MSWGLRTAATSSLADEHAGVSSVRIAVYVQPRAARTELAGTHDGLPKIRLAASPVEGQANAALVDFIAGHLKIAKSRVRIAAGLTGRRKWIEIDGLEAGVVAAALGGNA